MSALSNIKRIFFIGIGGIGMSALAKYFNSRGIAVSGYDRSPSLVTKQLQTLGIEITFDDAPAHIPEHTDMAIYTPAVPASHPQLCHLKTTGIPVYKRAEILGMLTADKYTVAVAGTHGKTTISSIIAHIIHTSGTDMTAFLGGILRNCDSNYIGGSDNSMVVVEADEYDRSFLQLSPDIAVISAMDADHLDIYGTHESMIEAYNAFAHKGKNGCRLVVKNTCLPLLSNTKNEIFSYGTEADCAFRATDISISDGGYNFTLLCPDDKPIRNLRLNTGGRHNIENACAAAAVCCLLNIPETHIREGLKTFAGVMRRFDVRLKSDALTYIDDYAHHPEEVRRFVEAVKELYPGKHITGIFQPHLYSRTRDFAEGFAESLSQLDAVVLLDIYPARELPIEGVSSQIILDNIKHKNKMICSKTALIEEMIRRKTDIILTIGAGDIDTLVSPLEKSFSNLLKFMQK